MVELYLNYYTVKTGHVLNDVAVCMYIYLFAIKKVTHDQAIWRPQTKTYFNVFILKYAYSVSLYSTMYLF